MLRFEWNALRTGDRVLVHDRTTAGLPLLEGVVDMVDVVSGGNDVGIRTTATDGTWSVRRPPRFEVHLVPLDGDERCWACITP